MSAIGGKGRSRSWCSSLCKNIPPELTRPAPHHSSVTTSGKVPDHPNWSSSSLTPHWSLSFVFPSEHISLSLKLFYLFTCLLSLFSLEYKPCISVDNINFVQSWMSKDWHIVWFKKYLSCEWNLLLLCILSPGHIHKNVLFQGTVVFFPSSVSNKASKEASQHDYCSTLCSDEKQRCLAKFPNM